MDKLQKINFIYNNQEYNIIGDYKDYIFKKIQLEKIFFEFNILKTISSFDYDGIYIDIGSNIGNHSLYFANHCKSIKVYSIECFPDTYNILKQNINNNQSNVEIITLNCAIGDKIGETYLIEGKENNSGTNKTTDDETKIKIKLTTLDDLFDYDNIAVIKIDVEGDELKVINGALNLIKKNHPLIIIEVHPKKRGKNLKTHKRNLKNIMDKLPDYEIVNKFNITYILKHQG